jgi:two-component sensor histidine kinase
MSAFGVALPTVGCCFSPKAEMRPGRLGWATKALMAPSSQSFKVPTALSGLNLDAPMCANALLKNSVVELRPDGGHSSDLSARALRVRIQYQRKLQSALARHQILPKEVNHRVKNSLQVVSSMLHLQASAVGDPELSERLNEASTRISAVGRAYERLAYNADYENIDLVSYLREVIGDLETAVAPCKVQLEAPDEIQFAADRAILVALVINELVLNAGKYAYANASGGLIWVSMSRTNNNSVLVSVRDEGAGLPLGFDPVTSKRLGTRLVNALAKQLGAEVSRPVSANGTNFLLLIPLTTAANS